MPIDRDPIRTALRSWIMLATGLDDGKVIWARSDGPRPKPPYAVLNDRLALVSVGLGDEERLTDTPGEIQHVGQRRMSVSLNFYGRTAHTLAEREMDYRSRLSAIDAERAILAALTLGA